MSKGLKMSNRQFTGEHVQALGVFGSIVRMLFDLIRVFYSVQIPEGFILKGKLNVPGDPPGYICLSVLDLIKWCWELV